MSFLDTLLQLLNPKPQETIYPVIRQKQQEIQNYVSNQPQEKFSRMTYYTPVETPSYNGQMLTATGTNPVPGYTAAISPNMLKSRGGARQMGDIVEVNGKLYRIEDLTNESILDTLDIYQNPDYTGSGLLKDVPYKFVKRDTSGLRYNY